jgi:shikimate dehydrogenase
MTQQAATTMYFIGVTTSQSMMMRLFPVWAEALGLAGARLVGIDLPLRAEPERYREVIAQIKHDPHSPGALITSHKIDIWNAAAEMFDDFDYYARLCREVSCIVKRDGRFIGYAKDALTSQPALRAILGEQYWSRSGGHVLCLGAGGAGIAITVQLLTQPDPTERPERIIVVNDNQFGLDKLRGIVEELPITTSVEYMLNTQPRKNDALLAALPPGSLIINATGMGKDRPGSPVTDAAIFPRRGIVWELNYRGVLDFWHQARAQARERELRVEDGWHYFVVSWADHIASIFNCEISQAQLIRLEELAEKMRG